MRLDETIEFAGRPMRIAIVNTLYPPIQVGGAEKSVSLLAEALARRGDEVTVISLHPEKEPLTEMRNGVRVHRLPLQNLYWPFGQKQKPGPLSRTLWHLREMWNAEAARGVGRILDAEKPAVVHTNNVTGFSAAVWREARSRGIRLVHTLRDYTLVCLHGGMYRKGSICRKQCADCRAFSVIRKRQSASVDAVVSNSQYVLNAHAANGFFPGVPSRVIYNIADLAVPCPTDRDSAGREDGLTFGFIGMLEQKKGIEVVLEASTRLRASNWRLLIAGRGLESYVEGLKKRYTDPRIEWLGFVSAEQFYPRTDVIVIASLWPEPLARTFLEAMAYRRAAICVRSGGMAEVAALGAQVETYDAESPESLASVMDRALADPGSWRSGGFRSGSAAALFSEEHVATAYRRVYFGQDDAAEQ